MACRHTVPGTPFPAEIRFGNFAAGAFFRRPDAPVHHRHADVHALIFMNQLISFFVVVLFLPQVKIASAENNPFDARAIFSA